MPVLKYREYVGAPWQVVGVTSAGLLPQIVVTTSITNTISVTSISNNTSYKSDDIYDEETGIKVCTFTIPNYGDYSVEAIYESYTSTKTIHVDSVSQYAFRLDPKRDYVYDHGVINTDLVGGLSVETGNYTNENGVLGLVGRINNSAQKLITNSTSIDFTPYSRVAVHITEDSTIDSWFYMAVGTANVSPASSDLSENYATIGFEIANGDTLTGWKYLDISTVEKTGRFALNGYQYGNYYIDEIYFEKL